MLPLQVLVQCRRQNLRMITMKVQRFSISIRGSVRWLIGYMGYLFNRPNRLSSNSKLMLILVQKRARVFAHAHAHTLAPPHRGLPHTVRLTGFYSADSLRINHGKRVDWWRAWKVLFIMRIIEHWSLKKFRLKPNWFIQFQLTGFIRGHVLSHCRWYFFSCGFIILICLHLAYCER